MPRPNVGERDARLRQIVGGAGLVVAAAAARKHPVLALATTVAAVDLLATAAARWCWTLEMLDLDTHALDSGMPSSGARGFRR
ncbi:MAG TPA: YgaP-like transmembrane domain [Candidatus Thermoplasmatota archaeon]|nr:YgaP-like transmembrane domain [Candidatus Thermoplasmatota archaeon]